MSKRKISMKSMPEYKKNHFFKIYPLAHKYNIHLIKHLYFKIKYRNVIL